MIKLLLKNLNKGIAEFIEKFRVKYPAIWFVIFGIASLLHFGIGDNQMYSLIWITNELNIIIDDTILQIITWVLVAITSTKTTASLSEKTRQKKIYKTKKQMLKSGVPLNE